LKLTVHFSSLELYIAANIDGTAIPTSIADAKSEIDFEVIDLQKKNQSKMEKQLENFKMLVEDKQEMAILGQALYNEVEIYYKILKQELERVLSHIKQQQIKMESIRLQAKKMKIGTRMIFKPKLILHYEETT
jgi:hypothetical protein